MPYPIIEITQTSKLFPPALLAIGEDCPERLWLRGNLKLLKAEKSVAIIGARAAQFPYHNEATAGNDNLLREGIASLI